MSATGTFTFSAISMRAAREAAGLTPEQVAVDLGRSAQSIRSWEAGRHAPTPMTLVRLAELLGVTAGDLRGDA